MAGIVGLVDAAEIAAYIAAQQAADPSFDGEAVWAEYRYELEQRGKL